MPLGRTVTIPAGIWWEDDDAYPQLLGAVAFRGNTLGRIGLGGIASRLSPGTRALVVTGDSRVTAVGQLAGRKIGVNGVNGIGTVLVAALVSAHGISPGAVRFVTDPDGFPAMPGTLERGAWSAAFLAEPYITAAGTGHIGPPRQPAA